MLSEKPLLEKDVRAGGFRVLFLENIFDRHVSLLYLHIRKKIAVGQPFGIARQ